MNPRKVLMIPTGPIQFNSSRMRVHWLAEAWDEAWVWEGEEGTTWDELLRDVEVLVLQIKNLDKARIPFFDNAHARGIPVIWDVCDPIWWWSLECREIAQKADFIVASNDGLAALARKELKKPTICIPDRHKVSAFGVKEHRETDCPTLLWHGWEATQAKLWMCSPHVARLSAEGFKFRVIIVDNVGTRLPEAFSLWNWAETMGDRFELMKFTWPGFYKQDILRADVGLMPPYPGAWQDYKSDNATVCFWMAGIPVTTGESVDELRQLLGSSRLRAQMGKDLRAIAAKDWCIEKSVEDWKQFVAVL